jgi:predicted dehydrogenase/threonine dehydrogenase-like Zn-dependent dehydrogenase
MEQLVQQLKDGKMELIQVPFPALHENWVLVRNHYSLISAGTEGKTVSDARAGFIGKAIARKDELRKVIRTARTAGVMKTYQMVKNRLEAPSPLGYCSAGEIIEVAPGVTEFRVGDRVACGGNTANHAEVVAVPVNLCARVPDTVNMKEGSMTTMGAIALQGVRQAELQLGEFAVVIGLGLLGQLTLQLLHASGIRALGIDIDPVQVNSAAKNGLLAVDRNDEFLIQRVQNLTNGYGADAVIITASTSSNDPVNLAGELSRQKGKVVIVGAVSTDFNRTHYFRKELDLRMSCSYGPGRYDPEYEINGIDYPIGYVRWTENRNMQAFLYLISEGRIEPGKLISHEFEFRDCPDAYDLIHTRREPFLGIALKYDIEKPLSKSPVVSEKSRPVSPVPVINAGIIGVGSYAKNMMIPEISKLVKLSGVYSSKPTDAAFITSKSPDVQSYGNAESLIADSSINTVFITSRHDSHARYVIQALQNNKHVYVEKPLCLNQEELDEIKNAFEQSTSILMTGFNRRFSPLISEVKKMLPGIPLAINYRINAGTLPKDHWVHDMKRGGGRIIGEVCHFTDLCTYLAGSMVQSVNAVSLTDPHHLHDTMVATLAFENGSVASLSYFSNGNPEVAKEQLEIFCGGKVIRIDDFRELIINGKRSGNRYLSGQDKGHSASFKAFTDSIMKGTPSPVPFSEQYHSMQVIFAVVQSVSENGIRVNLK